MMNGYCHKNAKLKKDALCFITPDGFFSHGHYAVLINEDTMQAQPMLYTVEKRETLAIESLVGDVDLYELAEYEHIIQRTADGKPHEYLLIKSQENGKSAYVNRTYVDHVLTVHPLALPHIQGEGKPVVYKDTLGRVVGAIMPVEHDGGK
jgi:hypothetical protein